MERIAACRHACHRRYWNSHTIWDHTVLPAPLKRWHSRLSVVIPHTQWSNWSADVKFKVIITCVYELYSASGNKKVNCYNNCDMLANHSYINECVIGVTLPLLLLQIIIWRVGSASRRWCMLIQVWPTTVRELYNFVADGFTQRNFVADFLQAKCNFTQKMAVLCFWVPLWRLRGNVRCSS